MIEYDQQVKSTSQGIKRSLFDIVIFGPLVYVAGELATILIMLVLCGISWLLTAAFDQDIARRIITTLLFTALGYFYYWLFWRRLGRYWLMSRRNHGNCQNI